MWLFTKARFFLKAQTAVSPTLKRPHVQSVVPAPALRAPRRAAPRRWARLRSPKSRAAAARDPPTRSVVCVALPVARGRVLQLSRLSSARDPQQLSSSRRLSRQRPAPRAGMPRLVFEPTTRGVACTPFTVAKLSKVSERVQLLWTVLLDRSLWTGPTDSQQVYTGGRLSTPPSIVPQTHSCLERPLGLERPKCEIRGGLARRRRGRRRVGRRSLRPNDSVKDLERWRLDKRLTRLA